MSKNPGWAAFAVTIVIGLAPYPATGASKIGEFTYEGIGPQSCAEYVDARDTDSARYPFYVGWVAGFLSGYNQFVPDTADITPWQSVDLIAAFLYSHCQENPSRRFVQSVNLMTKALAPKRMKERLQMVQVSAGGQTIQLYKNVIVEAQQALAAKAYPLDPGLTTSCVWVGRGGLFV